MISRSGGNLGNYRNINFHCTDGKIPLKNTIPSISFAVLYSHYHRHNFSYIQKEEPGKSCRILLAQANYLLRQRETEKKRERFNFCAIVLSVLGLPAYITSEDVASLSNDLYIINAVLRTTWKRKRGKAVATGTSSLCICARFIRHREEVED